MDKEEKNRIPDSAKLVFKGVIHDVYQWEQEMFDGSHATFERVVRGDTAGIIAVVGDKIILQDQEQPHRGAFVSLPGGVCNKGEEAIEGAKRELLEETGYVPEEISLWKTLELSTSVIWHDHYFIARNCRKVQETDHDNGERIENRLINFDEFLMLSENERFRHRNLVAVLLHLRLHPEEQAELKKLLFN